MSFLDITDSHGFHAVSPRRDPLDWWTKAIRVGIALLVVLSTSLLVRISLTREEIASDSLALALLITSAVVAMGTFGLWMCQAMSRETVMLRRRVEHMEGTIEALAREIRRMHVSGPVARGVASLPAQRSDDSVDDGRVIPMPAISKAFQLGRKFEAKHGDGAGPEPS